MRGDYGGTLSFSSGGGGILFYTGGEGSALRFRVQNSGNLVFCGDTALGNTATAGFVLLPTSTTTGVPTGVPADFSGTHTPMFYNRTDSKVWFNEANTWKFCPTTIVITPTITNSVTSGGTDDTIDNVVAAPVDTNAASLVSTRNAIYQLARKLKMLTDLYD